MVGDQRLLVDRFAIATGGHNSGDDPEVISEVNFANGKNVTVRGGRVKSRPRFRKVMDLPPGKFQGAYYYPTLDEKLFVVSGKLYRVKAGANTYEEVSGLGGQASTPRVYFCDVAGIVVIQDGVSLPRFYDGNQIRVAKADEVPIGTVMHFANGRLHVATSGSRRALVVGDIFQGNDPWSALKFTETGFLFGGGDFAFPSAITALTDAPVIDTASGQGTLLVGTERDIFTLHTEVTSRDSWSQINNFQTLLLPGIGVSSHLAFTKANMDVFFRTPRSLRSLRLAKTDLSTPGFGGLHQEMPERFRSQRDSFASSIYFDDRLLVTVDPQKLADSINQGKQVFNGLAVVNFDSLNRMGQKSPTIFDGFWDGHHFAQLFTTPERGLAVTINEETRNSELWELLKTVEPGDEDPVQYVDTRALNAGDPGGLKTLQRLDVWLSEILTPIKLDISVRPNGEAGFIPWETLQFNPDPVSGYSPGPIKQHVSRATLSTPPEGMVSENFQFRFAWTGQARLDLAQAYMQPVAESRYMDNDLTLPELTTAYDRSDVAWYQYDG